MHVRDQRLLIGILVVIFVAGWISWPSNPGIHIHAWDINIDRDIKVRQGLDLRGGMQVLMEADVPASEPVPADAMDAARTIMDNRVNALGVTEPNVQRVGERRIMAELPGIENSDQAVAALQGTGRLEFIDAGSTRLLEGTVVKTTYDQAQGTVPSPTPATTGEAPAATTTPSAGETPAEAVPTSSAAPAATTAPATGETPATAAAAPTAAPGEPTATPAPVPTSAPAEPVYTTIISGKDLKSAAVGVDEYGKPEINFVLNPEGAKAFGDFTSANVGRFVAITMDGTVISCASIRDAITDGSGRITGNFKLAEAQSIVVQLKYGALPIPLKIIEQRQVGPTLGEDSVARSVRAGVIGLIIVLLFMLIYYRLPGLLADFALITYALVTFALFKAIPVTLTLPGVTGFLLSVGMAVDANILIFERMKEELRHGKSLAAAIDAGFDRAWTSIRDSNLSTLITCIILFWFGSNYGASAVKGFAVTLFLGVVVSMFTAITVTRTFMRATFAVAGESLRENHRLLGA